jgi:hypothetical protein
MRAVVSPVAWMTFAKPFRYQELHGLAQEFLALVSDSLSACEFSNTILP